MGKKSVEGFLTFLYHFVVPGLQAAQAVKDFAQKGSKRENLVLVFLGRWFWNHCSVIRQNLLQSILMRMTHTFAAWLPLQVWPGWKCVWIEDSQPGWNTLGSLILKMFSTIPMFGGMVDKEDHGIPASLLNPEDGVHWEHLLSANPMAKVIGGLDGLSLLFPNHCVFFLYVFWHETVFVLLVDHPPSWCSPFLEIIVYWCQLRKQPAKTVP